jgi:hypothetical protein
VQTPSHKGGCVCMIRALLSMHSCELSFHFMVFIYRAIITGREESCQRVGWFGQDRVMKGTMRSCVQKGRHKTCPYNQGRDKTSPYGQGRYKPCPHDKGMIRCTPPHLQCWKAPCLGGSYQNRTMIKTALLMPALFYGRISTGDIYEMYIHG